MPRGIKCLIIKRCVLNSVDYITTNQKVIRKTDRPDKTLAVYRGRKTITQRGDSNEYTQYTILQYRYQSHSKLSQFSSHGNFF